MKLLGSTKNYFLVMLEMHLKRPQKEQLRKRRGN